MSDTTPAQPNEVLEEILLRYGLSPETFHKLRADSYEKVLAGHSLEQLDLFYALLLEPKLTNQDRAAKAPYWPKGSKLAGEPPSEWVVREARRRMFKERSLNNLGQVSDFIDHMRQKLELQSAGNQKAVLDTLLNVMGEELLVAKMEGDSVSDNREVVDRLLMAKVAKDKAELEKAKLELKQQESARKEKELHLEQQKFQRITCEKVIDFCQDEEVKRIATSSAPKAEKIEQLGLRIFGAEWEAGQ